MPTRISPIEKFAKAAAKCSVESSAYGKCIVVDYNSVHKDKCLTEFLRLKNCYVAAAKKP
ncbi:hypothetical protein LARI1_G005204 [Lachnellula arida]|uniref:Conidiophore development hymA protein n=3 Tax=Lachnellula TaxID=47830 RepID=A0A8T9BGK0_9HELO|nr:hypothetical protein LARI1_G005204 [Lachnellula arida]TVY42102.1 hypothetical protein LSUB1_G002074 [Lachnellula subtilissima]TVY92680.1 hypothetical protein LAWI1_G002365 [Lachnellula willkommii]